MTTNNLRGKGFNFHFILQLSDHTLSPTEGKAGTHGTNLEVETEAKALVELLQACLQACSS